MTTVKVQLATESRLERDSLGGAYQETFSPECLDSMAEQAVGLPVTVNFEGPPIGRVLSAERTDSGLTVEVDIPDGVVQRIGSPVFRSMKEKWNVGFTKRKIEQADLREIGLTDD